MIIGALGAIGFYKSTWIISIAKNKIIQLICWFVIFLVLINRFHIASFIDNEIITVITVFIIIGQITKSSPINGKQILRFSWENILRNLCYSPNFNISLFKNFKGYYYK